jgi:rhodanese-related sulfurtransferase
MSGVVTSPREVKDALYEQFARVGKVTAHPKRLELLDVLLQGERSVEDLAAAAHLPMTSASAQLQVLRQARLVATRRDGKRVLYRIADDTVYTLVQAITGVARARLSEVEQTMHAYFDARDQLEPVDAHELHRRAAAGQLVVLDVRPAAEYTAGHIPGAVSIPLDQLTARLAELPAGIEIVAYCRGPYCVLAAEAVHLLRHADRRARRLATGWPQWRHAGLPVATGPQAGTPEPARNQER